MSASQVGPERRPVVACAALEALRARQRHGARGRSTSTSGRGEFVSLIGPSGCGKSTLLRIIGDLIQPTEGTVHVNGKPAHQARIDRDYGIVFQDAVLYDWRTVARNISLPLELAGVGPPPARRARPRDARARRADGLREAPSVAALGRDAAARLDRPRALVLAGAAADGRAVRRARRDDARAAEHRAAADLAGAGGSTVVFVTHSIAEAVFLSTRVVVMSAAARPDRRDRRDRPAAAARPRDARGAALLRAVTEVRRLLREGHADGRSRATRGAALRRGGGL